MISRIKNRLKFKTYDFCTRKVLSLPELTTDPNAKFSVLSMLCKRDIYQYLVALHSLFQYVKPRQVIIINDGTLGPREQAKLCNAIPSIVIKNISDYRITGLPTGGCWERIAAVAAYSKTEYIVQLDADTLFLHNPKEMLEAISTNRPFALPTESGTKTCIAADAIAFAQKRQQEGVSHIQIDAEANLDIMGDIKTQKYIRACAGFAGYAPNTITNENLLNVSKTFEGKFKERWSDWGTEQFTSNYLLANTDSLYVLPIDKYDSVDRFKPTLSFVHFIGCYRFDEGIYVRESRRIISTLRNQK